MRAGTTKERFEELRELVAYVLDIEPGKLTDTGSFVDDYCAESISAIELLARAEKKFNVEIDQSQVKNMTNLEETFKIISAAAGWQD